LEVALATNPTHDAVAVACCLMPLGRAIPGFRDSDGMGEFFKVNGYYFFGFWLIRNA